ncbi:MAG TPA: 30S ribosomal protein S6 [Candidatus Saccharimonadales bacterium]|nr:30S ribosomal protein S6 [Candidatus Saccharimonadales bacterium]
MNNYELAVLYHPTLEVDLAKAEAQLKKVLDNAKAKIVAKDDWGKRKLAYPIKKQDHAIYVFYTIDVDPKDVRKIESALNITDEIIRYLIVKPNPKAEALTELARVKRERAEGDSTSSENSETEDDEKE